jgi:hypothetical protein
LQLRYYRYKLRRPYNPPALLGQHRFTGPQIVEAVAALHAMMLETPPKSYEEDESDSRSAGGRKGVVEVCKAWKQCVNSFYALSTGADVRHVTKHLFETLGRPDPNLSLKQYFGVLGEDTKRWIVISEAHPKFRRWVWRHLKDYPRQWCEVASRPEPPPPCRTYQHRKVAASSGQAEDSTDRHSSEADRKKKKKRRKKKKKKREQRAKD